MKRVLFISSTGGHYNELMQLKSMFEKYNYHIITEKDKVTEEEKAKYGKKNIIFIIWDKSSFIKIYFYFIHKLLVITFLLYKIQTTIHSNNWNSYGWSNVLHWKNIWKQNYIYRNICK